MALIGGGGAGNVAGGNPSGTSSGLNYIGNHVYAHSGSINVNNIDTTLLDFTIAGNQYITAKITIGSKAGHGDDMNMQILINGELIYSSYEALVSMPTQNPLNILLPPESRIVVKARNVGSATDRAMECVILGRVYT